MRFNSSGADRFPPSFHPEEAGIALLPPVSNLTSQRAEGLRNLC
jgi:hypothetical protein